MSLRFIITLAALVSSIVGCGGPSPTGSSSCGTVSCTAGQHCSDPRLSVCSDGCLADTHCGAEQRCDTSGFSSVGRCVARTAPPATDASASEDPLAACRATCALSQRCGVGAAEAAQCLSDCAGLPRDRQSAVGACSMLTCAALPMCLGVECVGDAQCTGGARCVGYRCL